VKVSKERLQLCRYGSGRCSVPEVSVPEDTPVPAIQDTPSVRIPLLEESLQSERKSIFI
jgi:hypothetical protein